MPFSRASGLLLHPTCLPSPFGIGDLGPAGRQFVDFLQRAQQQWWQVLPLGPTGYGNSPYLCYSATAGNPLLISPEDLAHEGLLAPEDWRDWPACPAERVDFETVISAKYPLLERAWQRFQTWGDGRERLQTFADHHRDWLPDYALFMALKEAHAGRPWYEWDASLAGRDPQALTAARTTLQEEVAFQVFLQYWFDRQWQALKHYAHGRRVRLIGDVPFYVSHDSADVWAAPDNFCLDPETGAAALMAGVPPDYFSAEGQLWGNPVYNWDYLKAQNFQWWVARFRNTLNLVDVVRIDHFRGFQAFWQVAQGETTAIKGVWVEAPGAALFEQLRAELGDLPVLAEDLGVITPEVEALRDQFAFPGTKVLQFAFDGNPDNFYLPFNYSRNCAVYSGTHDNNTTVGWYAQLDETTRLRVRGYLGYLGRAGIHWDMIRLALSSVAVLSILPLQDVLGLGSEGRMNRPGEAEGNWTWRYETSALSEALAQRLADLTVTYGRQPRS